MEKIFMFFRLFSNDVVLDRLTVINGFLGSTDKDMSILAWSTKDHVLKISQRLVHVLNGHIRS